MSDYEIYEIRRIRHRISAEHGHDLKRMAEYYHRIEQELRNSGKFKFFDASHSIPAQEKRESGSQTTL